VREALGIALGVALARRPAIAAILTRFAFFARATLEPVFAARRLFILFASGLAAIFKAVALAALGAEAVSAPAPTAAIAIAFTIMAAFALGCFRFGVLVALAAKLGLVAAFGCFAARGLVLALVFAAFRKPLARLRQRHSRLHRAPQPEIVVGVLQVILAQDAIAGTRRIARQLQIALIDVGGRPANFRIRPSAF
jgi:hypothetical protein